MRFPAAAQEDTATTSWVERAREGDVKAFEELYHHHVGRIYALCLRMCGESSEADEMTQAVFVRAWEKLGQFRGESALASWLHRLAVNTILDSWRARGRQRERVVTLEALHRVQDPRPDPSRRRAIDLERALRALPPGARTVFVLHDVQGYRHREIADLTGLAVGTCKAQLHRARRLLRQALA